MDGEGVDGAGKQLREGRVHHPVPFDPGLSGEGFRNDVHAKMSFATRPSSGMAGMEMRLIDDVQALRMESLHKLFLNSGLDRHDAAILFSDKYAP